MNYCTDEFYSCKASHGNYFHQKNINRSNVLCVYILNIFWSVNESIAINNIEATVYLIMFFLFVYVHMYCVMFIIT